MNTNTPLPPCQDVSSIITYDVSDLRVEGAYNGTSWSPEQREESARNSYAAFMAETATEFREWCTSDNHEAMKADLEQFRQRYVQHANAYYAAHSRVMSQFITGAGGWKASTIRANNKRNDTTDRRLNEWITWTDKALSRLRRRYNPRLIAKAPILSTDADAITKLKKKIAKAEEQQTFMKTVNRITRRKTDESVREGLRELSLSEDTIANIMRPDWRGKPGFARYQLTNNSANIRRMKKRLTEIAQMHERSDVTLEFGALLVEADSEANRIRIIFPGKPTSTIRSQLKSNGFRWSPRNEAWQAYWTATGISATRRILVSTLGFPAAETDPLIRRLRPQS